MLDCLKICFSSLHAKTQSLLRKLKSLNKQHERRKRRQPLDSITTATSFLHPSEDLNQLKQVFKLIDTNGDGKISPLELSQVLVSLGFEKSRANGEAEGMINEMDCNRDGFVDLDEFIQAVKCEGHEKTADARNSNNEDEDEDEDEDDCLVDAFSIYDCNKDGLISAGELQRVMMSLGFEKSSFKDCRRMIEGVDKDGDGFVDFREFRSMLCGK